jgi:hypothetical protein
MEPSAIRTGVSCAGGKNETNYQRPTPLSFGRNSSELIEGSEALAEPAGGHSNMLMMKMQGCLATESLPLAAHLLLYRPQFFDTLAVVCCLKLLQMVIHLEDDKST